MLGNCAFFFVLPWWLTLCPIKWSSSGMGFLLGTPLKIHCTVPDHTYHFSPLKAHISLSLGILGCIDPRRGLSLILWEEGVKGLEGLFLGKG
jgi:hypothetical protein